MIFKIEVDKIYIYPFGGISKFHISLNEKLWKELIILIMGPLTQFLFYLLVIHLGIAEHYQNLIKIYNYTILGFNLLPIYPLDGGKLLNILLSYQTSFRRSLKLTIFISYLTVFLFSFYFLIKYFSMSIIVVICFLVYKVKKEDENSNYLMDKFLLERYLHHYHFKKRKDVNTINDFMRNRRHIVKSGDKYHTEREMLYKKFNHKY